MFLASMARVVTIDKIAVAFEQDINGLRPFIGEIKYIEFKSKWVMMQTLEEWKIINDEIENLKTQNNLKFNN